jgi:Skp family chaperone for outer membrane proteins
MIKQILTTSILIFALSVSNLTAATKALTIDMQKVFNDYYKVQQAQKKFQVSVKNANDEVELMVQEGQQISAKLQDMVKKIQNPALSEDAREKVKVEATEVQQQLRQKEADVNQYRQRMQTTLAQRRQLIISDHLDEIKVVISRVAKSRDADVVLNKSGESLMYARDSLEITEEVIGILNADAPVSAK